MISISTYDGTPCELKGSRTVWSGGKPGDSIKGLPIAICGLGVQQFTRVCYWPRRRRGKSAWLLQANLMERSTARRLGVLSRRQSCGYLCRQGREWKPTHHPLRQFTEQCGADRFAGVYQYWQTRLLLNRQMRKAVWHKQQIEK